MYNNNIIYRYKYEYRTSKIKPQQHPFYTKRMSRRNNKGIRQYSPPIWKEVKDLDVVRNTSGAVLEQDYIASAINTNNSTPTTLEGSKLNFEDSAFWYIIGRWLGDGWVRKYTNVAGKRVQPKYQPEQIPCNNCGEPSKRHARYENQWTAYCSDKCRQQYKRVKRKPNRNTFIVCCGKHEVTELESRFIKTKLNYSKTETRTTYNFFIHSKELVTFVQQFGKGAKNKRLTNTIIDLPKHLLEVVLEGYLAADGTVDKRNGKTSCTSVSKQLILGIQQCVYKVYHVPTTLVKRIPKSNIIEGREVNVNDSYCLSFYKETKQQQHGFYENGYMWLPYRSKQVVTSDLKVYNLSVETDESYTVNNHIVHNCSTFSMSVSREKAWGKKKKFREGQTEQTLDDLVFTYVETIEKLKPKVCLLENVKGIIQGNAKVYSKEIVKRLTKAGYSVQVFLLNAASMGVPQKRERVFFIGLRNDFKLPKLKLSFNEKSVLFGAIKELGLKQGINGQRSNMWDKCNQGDSFATVSKGSNFSSMRLSDGDVCNTITANQCEGFFHSTEKRKISAKEVKLIGSYPLDYNFKGLRPMYLIGMSVPPAMAAQIAHQIYLQWLSKC